MAGGSRRKRGSQKKSNRSGRQPARDYSFSHPQNESPLAEELTALSSIFQDDFNLSSEDPFTEFSIALHPHAGGGRSNVSAELHVRCLPGYPHKPPKLQVKCLEGLSEDKLHSLHSLLVDQASSISREGRVMVYNLVETAQEFLTEHIGSGSLQEYKDGQDVSSTGEDAQGANLNSTSCTVQDSKLTPVYGFVDLFTELGEESLWAGEPHQSKQNGFEMRVGNAGRWESLPMDNLNTLALKKAPDKLLLSSTESRFLESQVLTLMNDTHPVLREEDGVGMGEGIQFSNISELLAKAYGGLYFTSTKDGIPTEQSSVTCNSEESSVKCSSLQYRSEDSVRKDFLLAHLLRLVCCQGGPLPRALPALALQLQKLNVIPQCIMDFVMNQPQLFDLAFSGIFAEAIRETADLSRVPLFVKKFWNTSEELLSGEDAGHTKSTSRYSSDFEELSVLGKGGFGYVVLCRNNLDGRHYAMKKIRLTDKSPSLNNKILREVTTLSRLQHHHIVRYYQAWFETMVGTTYVASEVETSGEWEKTNSSFKPLAARGPVFDNNEDNVIERTYLYIQMEYCPRQL